MGVRELRQNLSVHLRRVKAGDILEVTERGVPVAQLAQLPPAGDAIARLAAAGLIMHAATGRIEDLPAPVRLPRGVSMSRALAELREERI